VCAEGHADLDLLRAKGRRLQFEREQLDDLAVVVTRWKLYG
jgi:hypothetical protein